MTYIEPEMIHLERVVCGAVIEFIILNLHVSRSMATVLPIDDARGGVNKNVWPVWYHTGQPHLHII